MTAISLDFWTQAGFLRNSPFIGLGFIDFIDAVIYRTVVISMYNFIQFFLDQALNLQTFQFPLDSTDTKRNYALL